MMESFRVDVILNSLKELQEEKGRNERILCEEYKKRKELEAQLEEALATHKVASDKNSKMKEAMKVAEMKVAQTQAQVKMMEDVNNEKRQRIWQLNQQMEQLERMKDGQLSSFESQMTNLTEKFRTAWQEFGDKALNKTVEDCEKQLDTLSSKLVTDKSYLGELLRQLDHLQSKQEEEQARAENIPSATWQMVIDIVKEENRASLSALEKERDSLQVEELKKQAEKLTKQLEELEGTLATLYHEE